MTEKTIRVKTCELVTDGLQTRRELSYEAVTDYAEKYCSGVAMPPVSVVLDKETGKYQLVDGFHRLAASAQAGITELEAEVVDDGDHTTALRHALRANETNGLRRTNADKRAALEIAWANREALFGGDPTERQLAEITGVSNGNAHNFLTANPLLKMSKDENAECNDSATERSAKELLKEGKDRFGQDIPENIRPAFKTQELTALERMILKCSATLKDHLQKGNPVFAKVMQQTLQNLVNAASHLRFAKAYCVCPLCHGDGCHSCDHLGWMNKVQHDRLPRERRPVLASEEV